MRTRILIAVAVAFFATLLAAAPASATPTYTRLALSGDYINHYNNPAYSRARADMWVDERLNTVNLAADDIRATTRMVKIYNVTRVQVDTIPPHPRRSCPKTGSPGGEGTVSRAVARDNPVTSVVIPAIMAGVEEVEVVVAHNERATLRVGDVFLAIERRPRMPDLTAAAVDGRCDRSLIRPWRMDSGRGRP